MKRLLLLALCLILCGCSSGSFVQNTTEPTTEPNTYLSDIEALISESVNGADIRLNEDNGFFNLNVSIFDGDPSSFPDYIMISRNAFYQVIPGSESGGYSVILICPNNEYRISFNSSSEHDTDIVLSGVLHDSRNQESSIISISSADDLYQYFSGSTAESVPSETAPLGTSENPYPSGMYKIGTDLPAGEYFLVALGDDKGYYCISSDSNKDDIIENDNFSNHTFITVSDGQYFNVSRACFVLSEGYKVRMNDNGSLRSGMYRIGIDIPAGEYKLDATDSKGYYCIYNDSVAPLDIVDNDLFENSSYVTVTDGQYLSLDDCIGTLVK